VLPAPTPVSAQCPHVAGAAIKPMRMKESSLLNLRRLALAELSALSLGARIKVLLSKPETLQGKTAACSATPVKPTPYMISHANHKSRAILSYTPGTGSCVRSTSYTSSQLRLAF
jgi:hypothetical protein